MFQPFLRFYGKYGQCANDVCRQYGFQPFLRFYKELREVVEQYVVLEEVSTLLEILLLMWSVVVGF